MSQMSLKDAAAKVTNLGSKDLAWIYRQLASGKPMRLAKRPEILTAVMGSLQQGATGDGENAVVSDKAAEALAGVGDGKPAPKKAETPAPDAKPDKPIKMKKAPKPAKEPKERDARLPAPGTTITKVWRDRTLEVLVGESDFTFDGKPYRSLSKIASELLGCPANGFLFFSLTEAAKEAAAKREEKAAAKQEADAAKAEAPKPEKKVRKQAKAKSPKKSKAKSK